MLEALETVDPTVHQEILADEWEWLMQEMDRLEELVALQTMNALEDTRGCERCSGCVYCEESSPGYDPADEL